MNSFYKFISILILIAGLNSGLTAQPQYSNYATTGSYSYNMFPLNAPGGMNSQFLYLAGDFSLPSAAPSGNIVSLSFLISPLYPLGPWTYTNFTISMGQSNITTLPTGTFYTGSMTTVYSHASVTLSATGGTWLTIPLDTPFPYVNSQSLIVAVGQCSVPGASGWSNCFVTGAGFRRDWSTMNGGCPYTYSGEDASIYVAGINLVTAGPPICVTTAATGVTGNAATLNGTVNANGASTTVTFQYGLTTSYGSTVPGVPATVNGSTVTPVLAAISGLTNNTTYHFRVVGVNSNGTTNGNDMTFTTLGPPPTVITTAATGIGSSTATLNGTVNANNLSTAVSFNYGLTTSYGSTAPGIPSPVSGNTTTPVSGAIAGLTPNTTYHFQVSGTSLNGTSNGNDMTFTTTGPPPTVVTTAATGVTGTTATLNGTVNANGVVSTVTFEYGLTLAYGTTVPGVPATVSGNTATAVSAALTGLLPGNTYHFRVDGVNSNGTSYGNDMTFITPALAPIIITYAATNTTASSATLNGLANANGVSTTLWFDWGLTAIYGTTVAGTPATTTGNISTQFSTNLVGLTNGTTYHYRARGVNSMGTTNGNDMTFTAGCFPAGSAGPITGPGQVCQGGSGYVYTVAPIANASGYMWTVPVGGSITFGANTNIITVSYSPVAVPGYVYVYATAVCGNGSPSQLGVAMNAPASPTIQGPANACLNIAGNVYTTEPGMNTYIWNVSAGGTITGGGTTSSNTVSITWTTAGAKTVSVNYTSIYGCPGLAPTVYNVTVNPLPVPVISGPSPGCTGLQETYTTQAGMNNYTWGISAGGTILSGSSTNTILVNWTATGAQLVSVNYTNANGCTATSSTIYPVTVNATTIPVINGPNTVCANTGYAIYSTQASMTAYNWTVSSGGSIAYGGGTNSISVTWATAGAQWVSVNFINPSGCSPTAPTQYNVTVNGLPGAAGNITGTATVCAGATGIAYSVAPITNAAVYVWTLPTGAINATGSGTSSILVNYANNAVSGNILVYGNNLCGNGTSSPAFPVTVNPLPDAAGSITGPASICVGAQGMVYTVSSINNATGYTWTVPTGATIVSGNNTNTITVDFAANAVSGNITVLGTNSCGNGTVSPNLTVTVNPIPPTPIVTNTGTLLQSSAATGNQWYDMAGIITGATGQTYVAPAEGYYWDIVTLNGCASDTSNHKYIRITGINQHSSAEINLYPVPNEGMFNVSIITASDETFSISVYNSLGIKIYEEGKVIVNGSLQKLIDLRPVPNGVYTVIFENSQNKVVKKIVVNK
jgi:hypothetical protein